MRAGDVSYARSISACNNWRSRDDYSASQVVGYFNVSAMLEQDADVCVYVSLLSGRPFARSLTRLCFTL